MSTKPESSNRKSLRKSVHQSLLSVIKPKKVERLPTEAEWGQIRRREEESIRRAEFAHRIQNLNRARQRTTWLEPLTTDPPNLAATLLPMPSSASPPPASPKQIAGDIFF